MGFDAPQRSALIALARRAIELGLDRGQRPEGPPNGDAALAVLRSCFVTLRIGGELRGCCGSLTATRALAEDVWHNAWASAFTDPRFAPLGALEWSEARVHISILSPLERLCVNSERQLIDLLQPHVDGLCLTSGESRATFLPAVWHEISDPQVFVRQLKRKAGWPVDFWPEDLIVHRYRTESFGEEAN